MNYLVLTNVYPIFLFISIKKTLSLRMSLYLNETLKDYISKSYLLFHHLVAHGYHHHSNLLSRQAHNFQDYLDKFRYQIDGDKG